MKIKFLILSIFLPFALNACGSDDSGKVSKGHRDAIHVQCKDDPDKKLCGAEGRNAFIEDGNEFVDLNELNKDQRRRVKMECVRSKKYGLESYNNCLQQYKEAALDNTLTEPKIAKKPKNYIEKLEQSVVYIEISLGNITKKEELPLGSGSGVVISKEKIATNCHVAMSEASTKDYKYAREELKWDLENDNIKKRLWIKTINGEKWAEAKLIKKNVNKDICIIKHNPKDFFKVAMKPISKFGSFKKLKKGSFVRAIGSPGGMYGFASEGSIQWLGYGEDLNRNFNYKLLKAFDKDTKFIVHGAKVHKGSSGGPLFDADGNILGLNTLISDTAAENIAVSADHIRELMDMN